MSAGFFHRWIKRILVTFVVLGLLGCLVMAAGVTWAYYYFTRDLPRLEKLEDYRPPAVTQIYDNNGTLVSEMFEERRYPVKLSEVPVSVRNAFLAAEDSAFYHHPGIDFISILRAAVKNLQAGGTKQGASTITQQVVKNLLLTPQQDYRRKIKEAILAYRIEKVLSKDEIFEIYLNQMFFGNMAYGIKAAAKIYFGREVADLSIAQSAMLAGLLKAPSRYSPVSNMEQARKRQSYVLRQMVKAGFITEPMREEALNEKIEAKPHTTFKIAPHYVDEVRRALKARFGSDREVDQGGFQVHTALDLEAYRMAERGLQKGLRETDKRRGWRGVLGSVPAEKRSEYLAQLKNILPGELEPGMPYPALVTEVNIGKATITVDMGVLSASVFLKDASWAKRRIDKDNNTSAILPEREIKVGDVVEVSRKLPDPKEKNDKKDNKEKDESVDPNKIELQLDQTPDIEGSISILDPNSGRVVAVVGGYDYFRYDFAQNVYLRNEFNRATQALRQPGSAFKPVLYLAAVDGFQYTPATLVSDQPRSFRVGTEFWNPANFDKEFLGSITLRTALEKSRNIVSADIISRIGPDAVIDYARKLGITTRIERVLSISLGSSEVIPLELARAYGVLAAQGVLFNSVFVNKIIDRQGNVIFDYENELLGSGHAVIDPNSAFILTNMMKGVVERGTGYKVKAIGRPVAGKTGTSNDQMDAWFIGYTPEWVCGVWVGFDVKREIGTKETGGVVAAPIWLYAMQDFLSYQDKKKQEKLEQEAKEEAQRLGLEIPEVKVEPLDFRIPDGVDPFWVDRASGQLASPGAENAIYEYFKKGTSPLEKAAEKEVENYLQSGDL